MCCVCRKSSNGALWCKSECLRSIRDSSGEDGQRAVTPWASSSNGHALCPCCLHCPFALFHTLSSVTAANDTAKRLGPHRAAVPGPAHKQFAMNSEEKGVFGASGEAYTALRYDRVDQTRQLSAIEDQRQSGGRTCAWVARVSVLCGDA